jgi:hypothetical protein
MKIEDEKNLALLKHKLEFRRIIFEKVLLGAIVVLLGLSANIVVENYRAKLTQQKFYIEKKFEALTKINESYNKMTLELFNMTNPQITNKFLFSKEFNKISDEFNKVFGCWSVILSEKFTNQTIYHYWIYVGINNERSASNFSGFRDFVSSYLMGSYGNLLEHELNQDNEIDNIGFQLDEWSYDKIDKKGAQSYAISQLNKWKKWKAQQSAAH